MARLIGVEQAPPENCVSAVALVGLAGSNMRMVLVLRQPTNTTPLAVTATPDGKPHADADTLCALSKSLHDDRSALHCRTVPS
jgi:hypothetical protein